MKAFYKFIILALITTGIFIGCDKQNKGTGSSNPNCDAYGYCFGGGDIDGYYGNPDAIVLEGGVTITDGGAWKQALDGLLNCNIDTGFGFDIKLCGLVNNASPRLQIVVDDYKFRDSENTSVGEVLIYSQQVPGRPYPVTWRKINSNSAFDTRILPDYSYDSRTIRVVLSGRITDSQIPVELFYGDGYNDRRIGSGMMLRLNR